MASSPEMVNTEEMQNIRASLRERFLRFIAQIERGQECTIKMYENTTVTANIYGIDPSLNDILVENLQTPFMPVKRAKLRGNDIISIHVKKSDSKSAQTR